MAAMVLLVGREEQSPREKTLGGGREGGREGGKEGVYNQYHKTD